MESTSLLAGHELSVLDLVDQAVWAVDASNRVVYANPAARALLHLPSEQDEPHAAIRWAEEDAPIVEGAIARAREGEHPRVSPHVLDAYGSKVRLDARFVTVRGKVGPVVVGLACTLDEHLAAARLNESRLRAVLETQTEFVGRFTREGVITFVNRAACEALGLRESDLLGKSVFAMLAEENVPDFKAALARLTREEDTASNVQPLPTRAGERWVRWTNRAIFNDRGQVIEYQGVGRDVTAEVEESMRLRAQVKSTQELLLELDHRTKNNLQLIMSLLRLQFASVADPTVREMLQQSLHRIEAVGLVHEHLSRAEYAARVDASEYLRALVLSIRAAHDSSVDVRVEVDAAAPPMLAPDALIRIGMIVCELLANAFKHAFVRGAPGHVVVSFTTRGDHEVLVVEDDGVGFAPDQTRSGSMGLQLVRALAEQLQATLEFTAPRGGGTRVTMVLRSCPAPIARAAPAASEHQSSRKST